MFNDFTVFYLDNTSESELNIILFHRYLQFELE